MRAVLLVILAVVAAGATAAVLGRLATHAWRKRLGGQMQTDPQWWEQFQKRVRGS